MNGMTGEESLETQDGNAAGAASALYDETFN
jgi:hypothetical protein